MGGEIFKAFIFDLNGTMIDDMAFHVRAWYHLVHDQLGKDITVEEVRSQMYGKNGEVMDRIFGKGYFSLEEADRLSLEKEKNYQRAFLPHLKLIDGLNTFLESADKGGVQMAIGSAAMTFNIDFVLDNLNLRHYFSAIVSADDVSNSKPDPETYVKAAHILKVAPEDCIVFEDAPKGVEAALNAGMKAVAITTMHDERAFDAYNNILFFIRDYEDARLNGLI